MRNSFSKKLELVQPDEGGNEFHVDGLKYEKQSPYNRISTIDHPLSSKNRKTPSKCDVRYDIKIELIKMDVEVSQTTKFQVQLKSLGYDNNKSKPLVSKKYKVPIEKKSKKTFRAYVEFSNDSFSKIETLSRFVNNVGQPQSFETKNVLLEILSDDQVVSSSEIELGQYANSDEAQNITLNFDSNPIVNLTLNIEMMQILDNFEESSAIEYDQDDYPSRSQSVAQPQSFSFQNDFVAPQLDQLRPKVLLLQIQSLQQQNQDLQKESIKHEETIKNLRSELSLLQFQNETQHSQKHQLLTELEQKKVDLLVKDQLIKQLQEQMKKQKQAEDVDLQKLLQEKTKELNVIQIEMAKQVELNNQVFYLKTKVSDLQEENLKKDKEIEQGLLTDIEETSVVKNLRAELMQAEKENEEMRNEILNSKYILNEQVEKYDKYELQSRKLKKQNKIYEQFMKIEIKSPQQILDDFRCGKTKEKKILSGYQSGSSQVNSPRPYSFRAVSQYHLDSDANIY